MAPARSPKTPPHNKARCRAGLVPRGHAAREQSFSTKLRTQGRTQHSRTGHVNTHARADPPIECRTCPRLRYQYPLNTVSPSSQPKGERKRTPCFEKPFIYGPCLQHWRLVCDRICWREWECKPDPAGGQECGVWPWTWAVVDGLGNIVSSTAGCCNSNCVIRASVLGAAVIDPAVAASESKSLIPRRSY